MNRGRGGRGGRTKRVTIQTHPYAKAVLSQLRVDNPTLDCMHDRMPYPDLLEQHNHGWVHILHMLVYASDLCEYNTNIDMSVVKWSILTHDCGRYHDTMQESLHGKMGAYVAEKMIGENQIDVDVQKVVDIVSRHSLEDDPLSTEESVVRTCDRLDLWRLPGFQGLNPQLVTAAGWSRVEKRAKRMRLEGLL